MWHQGTLTIILWLKYVTSILQTWSTKKSYVSFFSYMEYNSVFVSWKGYFFWKGYAGEEIIATLGFQSSLSFWFYQLFRTQACPNRMGTNGTHRSHARCHPYPIPQPIKRGWPHHWGLRPLLFSNIGVGSFMSHINRSVKVLWNGTCGFSSLSDKTRKSNYLLMSLQRQHFLLSY